MLAEAVEVIRELWTGEQVTHRGEHYTVENARIYTTPSGEIPLVVSAFGPQAVQLAAEHRRRLGDHQPRRRHAGAVPRGGR